MDCSQATGSSVREIFQARILEWVAICFFIGGAEDLPKCCWYLSHLDELGYLSISLGLKSKATMQMNLPFLVLFQANSSLCPEFWKELLTISGQKDGSCLTPVFECQWWFRGDQWQIFFPSKKQLCENWFLMRLERYFKALFPVLCFWCIKLLKNQVDLQWIKTCRILDLIFFFFGYVFVDKMYRNMHVI